MNNQNEKRKLEDVIYDHMEDKDLLDRIGEYLNDMAYCRESADELLDTIRSFDTYPIIYKKLFDLNDLLTREESERIKKEYESNFEIPSTVTIDDTCR